MLIEVETLVKPGDRLIVHVDSYLEIITQKIFDVNTVKDLLCNYCRILSK